MPLDASYLLYAWLIITTPAELYVETNTPIMRQEIQMLAVGMELLDPCETSNVFVYEEGFAADVEMLRARYRALKDAPPLSDSYRYPNREMALGSVEFNRAYRKTLEYQIDLHWNRDWFQEVISETDQLYYIWDLVRDSNCDYYYVTVRRQALQSLKDKLGKEMYYSGWLPPCVPIWRFKVVD